VFDLRRGLGMQPPEAGGFSILRLKINTKHLKNAKINYPTNFPKVLENLFFNRGPL